MSWLVTTTTTSLQVSRQTFSSQSAEAANGNRPTNHPDPGHELALSSSFLFIVS